MNSPENHVRYSKQITLTYPNAKKLSKDISCINEEIKAVLKDHNLEYVKSTPDPLPLSKEGFKELRSRLVELHEKDCISLNPSEVFELIQKSDEFLAFKQELGDFIKQLKMEVRIPEEVEITKGTPAPRNVDTQTM